MKKEKMITRTIKSQEATVLTVRLDTHETAEKVMLIPAGISREKICTFLSKNRPLDNVAYVAVISVRIISAKYAISEHDFIANAILIG